ncbi:mechanosensitive ion channel family protein [Rhizobium glycinendophyticum]|uniref:Mechanosensitive ion channel n=1 Tax=Rhizobium glycinendophyticum TaxID=2589807 RepID=A0A504UDN6_9HYPH|nr:mechanosensitive ion channel domain-containing protein [Rhizobium glycinendophyticum]TPP11190.1 mechanosensitive ion channel [Rhizobium glycinendophyticum]
MMIDPTAQAATSAPMSLVPPDPDLIQHFGRLVDQFESRILQSLLSAPRLVADLSAAGARLPLANDLLVHLFATSLVLVVLYCGVSFLSRSQRLAAAQARIPVIAMLRLTAWSLLPFLVTALVARTLLLYGMAAPAEQHALARDIVLAVVVWLASVTFLDLVLRPGIPHLRLVALNEQGARRAFCWGAALLAFAQFQAALLETMALAGMPVSSLTLMAGLAATTLLVFVLRLLRRLGHDGLLPLLQFGLGWVAILGVLLWIAGWVMQNMTLFQGMKGLIVGILIALAFDRSIALSIILSRRPTVMRLLFVIRVVVDAVVIAVILRVVAGYWLVGSLSLVDPAQWPEYSRRLNFALVLLVFAAGLAALIHAIIEARIMPQEALGSLEDQELRQARVSTVLPIIRFSLLVLIGGVFSLVALSALGIDTTPLMAGAGILGLAVSLGSQALVKDVISGVFWMLDDAFRLGEDVEIDGKPGRIERIQIRSLRLRGGDGRLHSIPYGQIEVVASRSRSLATARITIRLSESPSTSQQDRLLRLVGSTLRSEPAIHTAIVGKIVLCEVVNGAEAHELGLSFNLLRASAPGVLSLIPPLLLEVLQSTNFALAGRTVDVRMVDTQPSEETALQIAASTP